MVCGFSRVSASWHATAFGGALPRVVLVLYLRFVSVRLPSFLPSSPAPPVSYSLAVVFPLGGLLLYGCISSLFQHWSAVVLSSVVCLQSSFHTFVMVLFLPPSSFRPPSVSVGCVPSAFAMGSPWPGSSVGVLFLHSIGTKASFLSIIGIPSGWGHPLCQVCFPFPLDLDRRITLAFDSVPSAGVPGAVLLLATCSLGGLHRLPLCSSSLLCVASFCSVGFLFLASFLASPCWTFCHRFFF